MAAGFPLAAQFANMNLGANFYGTPTVPRNPNFQPEVAAQALKTAMKGLGTDEALIIRTLGELNSEQRALVALKFKVMFGEDLIKEIKSELRGDFEDACVAALQNSASFDAAVLRQAIKGAGTDEEALIEVLATRTNAEIKAIVASYKQQFDRDLEADLADDTSGDFKRFIVGLVQGARSEAFADMAQAQVQAKLLFEAGEKSWGTDEAEFQRIIVASSPSQVRAIAGAYQQLAGKPLEATIKSEFSGDIEKAYLAIVKVAINPPAYFAERLFEAMDGVGTKDSMLIRLIVSRADRDLTDVKQAFQAKYGKSLGTFIKDECSGDYKKLLLALANEQ